MVLHLTFDVLGVALAQFGGNFTFMVEFQKVDHESCRVGSGPVGYTSEN